MTVYGQRLGNFDLILPEDRLAGPGTSAIMAAFTHLNPDGSRFSDGTYGVFYAGNTLERRLSLKHGIIESNSCGRQLKPPMELDMRVYLSDLDKELHDMGGGRCAMHFQPSMLLMITGHTGLREAASRPKLLGDCWHDSVRHDAGECVGVFRPPALRNCRQERHLCYVWDGNRISTIYQKLSLKELSG